MLDAHPICDHLVDVVLRALENERAIDARYRQIAAIPENDRGIPNYKVMKQLALQRQFKSMYPVLIALAPIFTIVLFPYYWICAFFGALVHRQGLAPSLGCRILATTPQNINLIKAALTADHSMAVLNQRVQELSCFELGRALGLVAMLRCVACHLGLIFSLFRLPTGERRDMILHARDSFALLMMAFDLSHSTSIVVTDDHYQRWSYILSHVIQDFRIVQHGFLDIDIDFPNSFGTVNKLYHRDALFLEQFRKYYTVTSDQLFSPTTEFIWTGISHNGLLLASSFPAIDHEIELLSYVKSKIHLPIIVKLHPAHVYDERRDRLVKLADLVFDGKGNPACHIFVSYNSFMEFDYRQGGVATISIQRCGGIQEAYEKILEHTGAYDSQ